LGNALRPGSDIGDEVGTEENTEISMAKRSQGAGFFGILFLINALSHLSTLSIEPEKFRKSAEYYETMIDTLAKIASRAFSAIAIIVTGTVGFAIALVILIATNAKSDYLWICVVGIALGLIGVRYTLRRAKRELVKNFY
jgi:type II secretory pathway component PulF